MPKDRIRRHRLAANARLVIERSSTHPVRYAITLHVYRDDKWVCIHTFDNSHAPHEHHEHAYMIQTVLGRHPMRDIRAQPVPVHA
jgi:hypothetical protein